jgi:translation initiation factor 1 (eIF-1/SUI1)
MDKDDRRVKLEEGEQRKLILEAVEKEGSLKKLGVKLETPYSTIKKYAQENFLLPKNLFDKIIKISQSKKEILNISYLPSNWGAIKGGKKGMETLQKKYRKELIKWRKKGSKNTNIAGLNTKKIKIPELNEKLAEFIGAYLGDGTLTKYFIRISGDYRYDIPYFDYLKNLVDELFGINVTITKEKKHNTMYLTIFSSKMCSFLKKEYGIEYGHKIRNKTIIPKQIIKDERLSLACMRGLIDTDGSISRRGRKGSQFCIQFTSHNKELLKQVYRIGKKIEIFTFGDATGTGTNKRDNIIKFFKIVGSSNLRHIVRFHLRFYENKTIYQKEVVNFYQKGFYKNLNLPFKIEKVL